ncbi:mitochondrial import receptor subunit TOM40 homolog 1-like [Lycorma delicatula]|uniref:mitochondrial import receptor subunit TOM40 homolog 1-like n=1 Tax=Lycorma delicatula TaxID=130591 RepID=UPI003F50F5C4
MGNVLASSQKDCGFPTLPPLPPPEQPQAAASGTGGLAPDKVENPGTMEDLHKRCKDVYPVNFEGARVLVNKGLSNHFQVSHTINMSSVTPSGYRFGATYVGTKQCGPNEAFPVLFGDIDPSGNLNANLIHQFGRRLRARFHSQIQGGKYLVSQFTGDYKGDDYTASLTLANMDVLNDTGVIVGQYLQSVTPRVALGVELAYQRSPQMPGGHLAILSLGARYIGNDYMCSGNIGAAGLHLCYYQKASEQLHFGVELETNIRIQESIASVGYQIDLPKADLSFKGLADSSGNVGAVLEKKLVPLPFTIALSGLINHSKNNFKLGLGFVAGG